MKQFIPQTEEERKAYERGFSEACHLHFHVLRCRINGKVFRLPTDAKALELEILDHIGHMSDHRHTIEAVMKVNRDREVQHG